MQTLNFQCGHCGKLMGVSAEFLGQQVRCPHCAGVVVAPSAPAPGPDVTSDPEPPRLSQPALNGHDDIFGAPADTGDGLFDEPAPRIEIPRHPEPPPVTPEPGVVPDGPPPDGLTTGLTPPASPPEPSPPAPEPPAFEAPRRPRAAPKIDWFIPLVVMPLVLYAIAVSVVAAFLYFRLAAERPSPFEAIPDVEGDDPGVKKEQAAFNWRRSEALEPLPERLHVKLGQTLTLGDLEVTPTKVERKRVSVHIAGYPEATPQVGDSLVLHLRLKNVSDRYRFTPLDNYFDRRWDGKNGSAPLTVLVAGKAELFGGPAEWYPRPSTVHRRRQWIEGRTDGDPKGVGPGEERATFVCTDGNSPEAVRRLFGGAGEGKKGGQPYDGKLLWRVQLRRGTIDFKGRTVPATCVVGVEFSSRDYGGG